MSENAGKGIFHQSASWWEMQLELQMTDTIICHLVVEEKHWGIRMCIYEEVCKTFKSTFLKLKKSVLKTFNNPINTLKPAGKIFRECKSSTALNF